MVNKVSYNAERFSFHSRPNCFLSVLHCTSVYCIYIMTIFPMLKYWRIKIHIGILIITKVANLREMERDRWLSQKI